MSFLQKIAAVWQNVSLVQRALLMAVVIAAGIACMTLTYWVQRPDMGVLYSGIEVEEAAKITDKISEKNIIYKLGAGGTTIYVPKESITQLRLDMAKEGLPSNGQKGYGIFDDEKIGISPFVQNVNLKRALQDEIAKSIQMIDGVTNVRVHIVKPEHALFSSQREQTSASVVLRIKPGYKLSPSNIAAIAHMVAGSIEGLKSENVTIVDSQGQLLSNTSDDAMAGGAGNVADYRERVEQNLGKKVEDMLAAVLGPGRAMVRISAEIDMTSSNVAKEIYDEGKRVPKKEEISSESETGARNSEEGAGSTKKNETILTEYSVPKTVEQTVELAGEIKSLTVAAFVDLSPAEVAASETDDKTKVAPASTAMIMDISEVEEIIKRAVGTKLAEGGLKVVNVKFNKPVDATAEAEESGGLDYAKIAGQASLGIMAVCALLVLKMFTGAKNKAAASSATGMIQVDSANNMALAGTENFDPAALRKKIVSSLQNNPEQVKQLFSSWLEDKRS
jgi:flagellar M-ring protein FliF